MRHITDEISQNFIGAGEVLKFCAVNFMLRNLEFRSGGILKPSVLPVNFKIPRRENFIS